MLAASLLGIVVIAITIGYFIGGGFDKKKPIQSDTTNINVDTSRLERLIGNLPNQILTSITNTSNTHKGKLGELIGYVSIKGEYDRLIPLGNIVDFVGISFPAGDTPGKISFIDIKTGKNARLNTDQRMLRDLIKNKQIEFIQISIDEVMLGEEDITPPN